MPEKVMCLFDIDGTLTKPRQIISEEMKMLLKDLKQKATIGLVGGSDLSKISEQMHSGPNFIQAYDYIFAENGLVAYKNGNLIGKENILEYIGEEKLQTFINFCLQYMSKLILPAKRGNFVEFRSGLINICPVGRSCSQKEREEFEAYDKVHKIRDAFVNELQKAFPDSGLVYSIGGQISFDCFPAGWDKTYCLKHIQKEDFRTIHFFGDKTFKGGNDYELFIHEDVIGHSVSSPEETINKIKEIFFS